MLMSFSFWGYVVAAIVTIAHNGTYVKQEREQQRRQQQLQMLRSRVDRRCLLSIPFALPGYGGLAYELSSPNLLLVPRQASIPWVSQVLRAPCSCEVRHGAPRLSYSLPV